MMHNTGKLKVGQEKKDLGNKWIEKTVTTSIY